MKLWDLATPLQPQGIADRRICNPDAGIVLRLTELALEPDDPPVFCYLAQVVKAERLSGAANDVFCSSAGLTREVAAHGAVGESIERFCATHFEDVPLMLAAYSDINEDAIEPEAFALFGDHQFDDHGRLIQPVLPDPPAELRDTVDLVRRLREFLPVRFTRQTPVQWAWTFDLTRGHKVLAPAVLIFMSCRLAEGESYIWDVVSTGLACGPSASSASLHALLEVIERDAVMITWANRLTRPRIRLESDPTVWEIFQQRFAAHGLKYHLFDVSLDLPGTTVLGILEDSVHDTYVAASATRLDARDAIVKVLLELVQGRIGQKRAAVGADRRKFREDFLDVYNFDDHAWLYANSEMRKHLSFLLDTEIAVDVCELRSVLGLETDDALRYMVRSLAERDLRVLVADLTTQDVAPLGYTVVRVLVPGLQGIDFAHARPFQGGRRLYEVPWKLGYRSSATTVDELNPIPHPLP